ncbi:TorF family putative porin [Acinetobacter kookii]
MKFTFKALSLAVVATASSFTFADETPASPFGLSVSGTAAITSDYRYRGMTQTFNDPAVQAGFVLSHDSGLYAGVWGSNVDFGTTAHIELDPYIGFATTLDSFANKPLLDVGLWYYAYPSQSDLNWLELYGKLTFNDVLAQGASLLTAVNYTNDFLGFDTDAWYLNATYSVPFGATGFGGVAALGYTVADDYDFGSGDDNYFDWKAGVTYTFASVDGLTAELAAVGTNIDPDSTSSVDSRWVDTGAVFTLTKAF